MLPLAERGERGYRYVMSQMSPEFLIEVGEALYGPQWQSELARRLNVSDRAMRHWVAGSRKIPPGIATDLSILVEHNTRQLVTLKLRLTKLMGLA